MSKKSNWGDPCILMGDIFIKLVDDCAQNSFEVSLMYCGAVEYYLKAKDIDKSSRNIKKLLQADKIGNAIHLRRIGSGWQADSGG